MNEKVTIDKLKKISMRARPNIRSYMNCNPINPKIKNELENQFDISVETIIGTFSTGRCYIGGESHMFLRVDSQYVSDCKSPVIIDGALDQFCIENYENKSVSVQIGPKEDIPKVAVITKENDLYSNYYLTENL